MNCLCSIDKQEVKIFCQPTDPAAKYVSEKNKISTI